MKKIIFALLMVLPTLAVAADGRPVNPYKVPLRVTATHTTYPAHSACGIFPVVIDNRVLADFEFNIFGASCGTVILNPYYFWGTFDKKKPNADVKKIKVATFDDNDRIINVGKTASQDFHNGGVYIQQDAYRMITGVLITY